MDFATIRSFVSLGFGHITAPGALDHIPVDHRHLQGRRAGSARGCGQEAPLALEQTREPIQVAVADPWPQAVA